MSKKVILNLGKGSIADGFNDVGIVIFTNTNQQESVCEGSALPPNPQLAQLSQDWKQLYPFSLESHQTFRKKSTITERDDELEENDFFDLSDIQTIQFSQKEFKKLCKEIELELNKWLDSSCFRKIESHLRTSYQAPDCFQLIVKTDNDLCLNLPWHLWSFFEDYRNAELCFSLPEQSRFFPTPQKKRGKLEILVISGNDEGINIKEDRKILEGYKRLKITPLEKPSVQELTETLWQKKWDIIYFAGHSMSFKGDGRIYLNQQESLTLSELKNALLKAVGNGLQLVIFNSCDGIGLAKFLLSESGMPQVMVMRELVPDEVAYSFIKYFVESLSKGNPFGYASREAREKLQGLEKEYPCATWLPVMFENPNLISISENSKIALPMFFRSTVFFLTILTILTTIPSFTKLNLTVKNIQSKLQEITEITKWDLDLPSFNIKVPDKSDYSSNSKVPMQGIFLRPDSFAYAVNIQEIGGVSTPENSPNQNSLNQNPQQPQVPHQNPPVVSDSPFYYSAHNGIPTTYLKQANGDEIPFIQWDSSYFAPSGYTPEVRAQLVTERLAQAFQNNQEVSITWGKMNGYEVILVVDNNNSRTLLYTLKPNQKGSIAVDLLKRQLDAPTAFVALREAECKTYINVKAVYEGDKPNYSRQECR
jgi:hypothetical protein